MGSAVPKGSGAKAVAPASRVCPVTAATLLAAMKAGPGGVSLVKKRPKLGAPACQGGYALARHDSAVDAKGNKLADDEVATFTYESGSWRYRGGSTADFCEGMPAATVRYFEKHFYSGCGR